MIGDPKITGAGPGAASSVTGAGAAEGPPAPSNLNQVIPQAVSDYLGGSDGQIPALSPPHGGLSLDSLIQALGNEERKLAVQNGLDALDSKKKEQAELRESQLREIEERRAKMEEKQSADKFLKVFRIVGAALGVAAGAALTVVGAVTLNPVMAIGGALLLTGGLSSLASAVSDGEYSIAALVGEGCQKLGLDQDTAKWVGFGVELGLQIIGCVMTMGAGFAGWGAKTAEAAVSTAEAAVKVVSKVTLITNIINGLNSAAMAGVSWYGANLDREVGHSLATTKEMEAILEKLRASMEIEKDLLEAVMKKYQTMVGKVMDIINENNQAQTTILSGEAFSSPAMA